MKLSVEQVVRLQSDTVVLKELLYAVEKDEVSRGISNSHNKERKALNSLCDFVVALMKEHICSQVDSLKSPPATWIGE